MPTHSLVICANALTLLLPSISHWLTRIYLYSYIVFLFQNIFFWLTFLSSIKPFLAKKRLKNVATNSFRQQTRNVKKKSYSASAGCQSVSEFFGIFLYYLEKNINSEAVQFAPNHLSQDRWWQIRKFFPLFSVILRGSTPPWSRE